MQVLRVPIFFATYGLPFFAPGIYSYFTGSDIATSIKVSAVVFAGYTASKYIPGELPNFLKLKETSPDWWVSDKKMMDMSLKAAPIIAGGLYGTGLVSSLQATLPYIILPIATFKITPFVIGPIVKGLKL